MKRNGLALALGICALMTLTGVPSAQTRAKVQRSGAETGLLGIKLMDSGIRVVALYGSPTEIQAVNLGGGGPAGPGGGAGAAGGAGGRGAPGGGGGPNPSMGAPELHHTPGVGEFGFGDYILARQKAGSAMQAPPPGGGGTGGSPSAPGGGAGPGAFGGGGGDRIVYTRWVYDRNGAKYSFILDRFNRVVQCEAIGITPGKATTRRGITFGSTFAQIIKKYGAPDGYEMNGDSIVVRYLSKAKCAFRLNKLGENKPDTVTGIVIAAGKR